MALKSTTLENCPWGALVHLALFHDVTNAAFLHSQLLARNPEYEYAFIDASAIFSELQLLSAAYRAINAAATSALQTPNVHSEVILSLSPNNNIADAYRRWGISPKTTSLIVIKIIFHDSPSFPGPQPSAPEVWSTISRLVSGTPVDPFSDAAVRRETDWATVRKYYKLNGVPALQAIADDAARQQKMEQLAIMGMALRGL
ncbi:kinase binding protein CGI-121-domain-containing protein [Podospora appendiculata]|uniref:EKC/KEOPS complex subunit CGI121 n=1 Tax=Podospora appendiculata TaxID=314037 RepID=A0AAE0XH58_9PEZI|nr:kinase binding protein CGI-121-domain-containing protein [Podospora appendiculata]